MKTLFAVLFLVTCCFAISPGFTPGSAVYDEGNGIVDIGAEALMPAGFSMYELPFSLPVGRSVTHFQGTVSWAAACQGDALFALFIGGHRYGSIILKGKGAPINQFFNFSIPVPTGDGAAKLHIEANPNCSGTYGPGYASFEIQAMMQVQ